MGKYKKGILGPFRGKVGTVIGAIWRGIHYLRSLPDVGEDNPTAAQLNVRAKMALVSLFLKRIKALINVGYQKFNNGITPLNAATSYHLKYAITGTSSLNYALDFEKVVFSAGDLLAPKGAEVNITLAAKLDFAWVNDAEPDSTNGTDKATLLVYNPTKDKLVTLVAAAPRSAEAYVLSVPGDFSGDGVHAWISFVSADGKQVSDSVYVGEFIVL
ncbi:DUF6266 family protein [Pedobacter heparinus]|uniref:Uncharacterized protein n=1 Tax=Pedobacter heparinus (strain ATCC 13125 / DSM 2366 / CIP 104194 / JCM 7457 / NBRC 12017 / NCIMB 9290 / NRRL B-14731 / HIM 762-3) TaxID=485917 RepID=C6XVH4_PEDHD|nr:DUF6266 family protein [Pedobacter heparinus]ACU04040.1 hypothetical protein Phep_1832 [Pedobacter heparinus DSM 2366]